eukprot:TRINITY_DN3238_c0_g1_i13.p1 TRINITY_DN3238_c0_g1~~TRINITY_DN3238_c0_g1_i13.p1  ORF type:complete len:265 (-),score=59.91 TRINITY_DN3238_c0_g1_i13:70-864(-)
MRRRIAEYSKIKLSNHNKGIQNLRNSSDHNSEEVTSNQQSNVDDKREGAIIKNTSPFIQNTTKNNNQNKNSDVNNDNNNDSNEKENLNNAKIIQIDSSLWKNLDQIENDDDNENSNDDENGAGFNDSVSGDSEKNKHQLHQKQQQDENDDDIWSEFQTKEEIQQQKIQQQKLIEQQNSNNKKFVSRQENANSNNFCKKSDVQAKIDQEIQDLDKQAAMGGQKGGYSSNSPTSGCNIRVTPSTDLLSIGLIRKKSVRNDLDEDYL